MIMSHVMHYKKILIIPSIDAIKNFRDKIRKIYFDPQTTSIADKLNFYHNDWGY
jgi:hypothetical protein